MLMTGKVWFVGAGPGDPELITVKGLHLLQQAGAILYAGSLVSEACMRWASQDCEIADSKGMTLEEITGWLIETPVSNRGWSRAFHPCLHRLRQPVRA